MKNKIKLLRLVFSMVLLCIFYIMLIINCKKKIPPRPNILWITCEDISPMLGCYGDVNAKTPNLDKFAQKSVKFTNSFATASVCSPSRSTIITGVYSSSLGSQHLRSEVEIPENVIPFPKYLKEAGYYVTNNSKEDYNFRNRTIWNESSKHAHWRNREKDQPFFSVFNLITTHQSQIFGNDSVYQKRIDKYLSQIQPTSPESLKLLPYYPDSPAIRKLWARYYTNVSIMDYQFGQILQELEHDGLAENTMVFFFSDHGTGMPRSKRALYDSGLKVPLLVHVPEKYADQFNMKPGTENNRIVSFVDFALTLLEIAGAPIPDDMQGQPFISARKLPGKKSAFGIADRVDEAYELARTVRTPKYRYIRNFMPFTPLLQPNYYSDQSEIMQELEKFRNNPDLSPEQAKMFRPERSPEELYDVEKDPHQMYNLATDPDYQEVLESLREKTKQEMLQTFDTGLMPEPAMTRLAKNSTPYEVARQPEIFPIKKIFSACDLMLEPAPDLKTVVEKLHHANGLVRYWTVISVESLKLFNPEILKELRLLLNDEFPTVQVEAAKTLIKSGDDKHIQTILKQLNSEDKTVFLYAARAFEEICQLLPEIPAGFQAVYEKLKLKNEAEGDLKDYYELYGYWALSEVFEDPDNK